MQDLKAIAHEAKSLTDVHRYVELAGVQRARSAGPHKHNCAMCDSSDAFDVRAYPSEVRGKCYSCGWSGDVIALVQDLHGVGFPEAVRQLAAELGIDTDAEASEFERKHRERAQAAYEEHRATFRPFATDEAMVVFSRVRAELQGAR